jgi:secreted PhoX family phosphatase
VVLYVVPKGYDYDVVVRWGDPILRGAPDFDFDNQTGEAQAQQSATTTTTSPSFLCAAVAAGELCWWSTTSTPTAS